MTLADRSIHNGLSLSRAGDEDLAFLRALYRSVRAEEPGAGAFPADMWTAFCDSQFALQQRHYTMQHPDADTLVVRRSGATIGKLHVDCSSASVHILDFALIPASRGCGIGTAILRTVQAHAVTLGKAVTLNVLVANTGAQRLYARLGFTQSDAPETAHRAMRWTGSS